MRVPPLWFTIRRMMIAIAVVGVGAAALVLYQRNTTYYASGWWEAGRELWRGEATIYDFDGGYTSTVGDFCCFDRDTGLPIHGVGWSYGMQRGGCERVHGHNDRIAQYIRWHGLPKNTLKPWQQELFDLYRYFDDRSRTDVPTRLLAGGPAVVSPDGRNSVRLVEGAKDAEIPYNSRTVVITAGNVVLHQYYAHLEKGESDLLWGPEGSRFAVIRSVYQQREHYVAYDLRTGWELRDESWHESKRLEERARANPFEYRSPIATGP
jgi:hypothetical protein